MHSAASAMHATAAVAHAPASATAPHLGDQAVVHVGCDARRSEDLEGLSLRQSETEKRNAKKHVSGQTRPTHGFPPSSSWATRSRIGNSSIRMTRSLDLTMISYVSRDGFPIAAPGLEARQPSEQFHFERCKGNKPAQVVAGPGYVAKLRIGLADARLGRWNRVDDDARASRHRLRGRVGRRRRSTASTPQSLVCWPTRSSGPVGSWCSDRTPR